MACKPTVHRGGVLPHQEVEGSTILVFGCDEGVHRTIMVNFKSELVQRSVKVPTVFVVPIDSSFLTRLRGSGEPSQKAMINRAVADAADRRQFFAPGASTVCVIVTDNGISQSENPGFYSALKQLYPEATIFRALGENISPSPIHDPVI